jgi:DNA-binding CsgD family transcriptional regulator/PAS domain-containing protein
MELGSDMLTQLYATVDSPQRWTPLLDHLRVRLGAGSAVVQILNDTPERLDPIWQARDTRSTAQRDLHDRCLNNPANPRLSKIGIAHWPADALDKVMRLGSDRRLFGHAPQLLSDLQRRLGQVGLGHAFWIGFPLAHGQYFSLILHREPGDDRDLGHREEVLLRELLPHMQQSARLRLSFEKASARSAGLEDMLDRLDVAMLLCDADLAVQWVNAAAEELIAGTRHLRLAEGRLQAPGATDILRRLVGTVASGAAHSLVGVIAGDRADPVHVRASGRAAGPFPAEPGQVALFLSQPNLGRSFDPAELGALYGLTAAEARLAAALAGGASLSGYSEQRGIAVGTARNQLKQVLAKTFTRSQSDLVRVLGNSVASRRRRHAH